MATTVWLPLDFRTPRFNTNPGSVYFLISSFGTTVLDNGYWVFDKTGITANLFVSLYAFAYVPKNMNATPNAGVVLNWATDQTTGNIDTLIGTKLVKDADTSNTFNPASFSLETGQTTTMPATAWTRKDVTYPSSGNLANTPAAGDIILIEIRRTASANDTLSATKLFLMSGSLRIDL